jgi:transcription elongation factor GreB
MNHEENFMTALMLTKKGYARLRKEYDDLTLRERPKVVAGVSNAAAEGDRSENAEYIYGKKRLREIDKRLQYLSHLLKNPKIIDSSMVNTETVSFGSKVEIRDEQNSKKVWTIVGEGEADFKERTISSESLVARSLLGKKKGDIVQVDLQKGSVEYEIIAISAGDIDK